MERYQELVKRSTTSFTRASSRMIFIMAMAGLFILTEITILAIGLMESGQDMDVLSISLVGSTKASGSIVNSWETEY
jgi:hypothetical protein